MSGKTCKSTIKSQGDEGLRWPLLGSEETIVRDRRYSTSCADSGRTKPFVSDTEEGVLPVLHSRRCVPPCNGHCRVLEARFKGFRETIMYTNGISDVFSGLKTSEWYVFSSTAWNLIPGWILRPGAPRSMWGLKRKDPLAGVRGWVGWKWLATWKVQMNS